VSGINYTSIMMPPLLLLSILFVMMSYACVLPGFESLDSGMSHCILKNQIDKVSSASFRAIFDLLTAICLDSESNVYKKHRLECEYNVHLLP
jgi:hypothetical protein